MLSLQQQQLRTQQPTSGFLHSQCLGLTALSIWVSLTSMCRFPFFSPAASSPALSKLVLPSQHLGFPVCIWAGRGAEGIYSTLPGGSHTSLFQFLSQTERSRRHFLKRGRESRSKSCLQSPGWLSEVILGKENRSGTRATAREFLRMISSLNKYQHTPKKTQHCPACSNILKACTWYPLLGFSLPSRITHYLKN